MTPNDPKKSAGPSARFIEAAKNTGANERGKALESAFKNRSPSSQR
jgi:hypothetical protein